MDLKGHGCLREMSAVEIHCREAAQLYRADADSLEMEFGCGCWTESEERAWAIQIVMWRFLAQGLEDVWDDVKKLQQSSGGFLLSTPTCGPMPDEPELGIPLTNLKKYFTSTTKQE